MMVTVDAGQNEYFCDPLNIQLTPLFVCLCDVSAYLLLILPSRDEQKEMKMMKEGEQILSKKGSHHWPYG